MTANHIQHSYYTNMLIAGYRTNILIDLHDEYLNRQRREVPVYSDILSVKWPFSICPSSHLTFFLALHFTLVWGPRVAQPASQIYLETLSKDTHRRFL